MKRVTFLLPFLAIAAVTISTFFRYGGFDPENFDRAREQPAITPVA